MTPDEKNPIREWFANLPWPGKPPTVKIPDLQALAENLPDIAARSQRVVEHYRQRMIDGKLIDVASVKRITDPFLHLTRSWLRNPRRLVQTQMDFWRSYSDLMHVAVQRMMGLSPEPVIEEAASDRRFRDPDWAENVIFDFIKQSYLLVAEALEESLPGADGSGAPGGPGAKVDHQTRKRLRFYTRQFIDAMSPSNFLLTNPTVLRATVESGGENLVRGLKNLLGDLDRGRGQLRISITDRSAFTIGENLATTPGKVVFQTELMQLIQYQPSTDKVHERPLLLVPPWINKYYILDLQPHNSFIKWAVAQGFTVFVVSWVNPDASLAHKRFDDYLSEGVLAALDAVEQATGVAEVNVVAYCIGGILMSSALAYLATKADRRVVSATFLTTLLDFAEVGDVDVFINKEDIEFIEGIMDEKGYFEAERMSDSFSMIRANDLIWGYVIRNYLLGKEPTPFDMLYWATDNTRMPAAMHGFYLRNYYLHNRLTEPGGIELLGTPLDLSKIAIPAYFLSTENDHIAPWQSTYVGAQYLNGPIEFVLGGSGHIAGVINPAGSGKYGYRTNPDLPRTAAEWLESATREEGSWWPHWRRWIQDHAGPMVSARVPGDGRLTAIEDAPGGYVRVP